MLASAQKNANFRKIGGSTLRVCKRAGNGAEPGTAANFREIGTLLAHQRVDPLHFRQFAFFRGFAPFSADRQRRGGPIVCWCLLVSVCVC